MVIEEKLRRVCAKDIISWKFSLHSSVSTLQFEDGFNSIPDHAMHPDVSRVEGRNARISKVNDEELTSEYWLNSAKAFVEEQLKKTPNTKKAKNILFFLGNE